MTSRDKQGRMAEKKQERKDWSRVRLVLVAVLFALVWSGLWARAAWIQVVEGPRLAEMADRQHLAPEFERGRRGKILDRKGRVLATSTEAKSVYIRPVQITDREAAVELLAGTLGMDKALLRRKMSSRKNFVWIRRQVGDRAASFIQNVGLPGIHLTTEYIRLYPDGHLAGQLIGFTGVDGQGLEGIELSMDDRLKGKQAKFVVSRDAAGRRLYLDDEGHEMDTDGQDVRLTIDAHIQDAAEQALKKAVDKYNAISGTAVVVDVESNEILAWANYPFFDPNNFRQSSSKKWRDRASLNSLEPGSTMKPFMLAAALQEGVVTPETLFFCEKGKFRIAGHTIRDTHPEEWLTAGDVVVESSNIGSAKIGLQVGSQLMWSYYRKLGFGQAAQLPLPGEAKGILREPKDWTEVDLATASFGQGVGVTAAQMARAYTALAGDGTVHDLRLTLCPEQKLRPPVKVFDSAITAEVRNILTKVVQSDNSGRRARIKGIITAGKTGTAQKAEGRGYGDKHMGSFVSMIPADHPKFLTLVMVDEPHPQHYGGIVAAPAVREINLAALAYAGMMPDDNTALAEMTVKDGEVVPVQASSRSVQVLRDDGLPAMAEVAPRKTALRAGANVPDVSGLPLRRAVEVLSEKGIIPVLKGRGLMVSGQNPSPGSPWPEGEDDVFILWLAGKTI